MTPLFFSIIGTRYCLCKYLSILFSRYALSYFPHCIIVYSNSNLTVYFSCKCSTIKSVVLEIAFLIGASLLLGILFKNMNIEFTYEWWFDRDTFHVLNLLEQYHTSTGNNVSLNTNWLYYPSFNFHVQERNLEWLDLTQFHFDTDSLSTTDFYYIIDNEANKLNSNYRLYSAYGDYSRRLLIHR